MASKSNNNKPKGYYWEIIGKILTGLSAIAAVVAVILALCDDNLPKMQKFLDKQSKYVSFLTNVNATDSVVANTPEFKLYNSIQAKIELYFRECQLLKFDEVPSSYRDEYASEVCKNSLKLLMYTSDAFEECNNDIKVLISMYPNKDIYFDFVTGIEILDKWKTVKKWMQGLADSNIKDKQQYMSQIRDFLNSKELYELLEARMNFLLSAYEAINVFKLQLMIENRVKQ